MDEKNFSKEVKEWDNALLDLVNLGVIDVVTPKMETKSLYLVGFRPRIRPSSQLC